MAKALPIGEDVCCLVDYNERGELFWEPRGIPSFDAKYAGARVALTLTEKGYHRVLVLRRPLMVHRLLWRLHYGSDARFVDHINGIRTDNRIVNLRDSSHAENQRNMMPRGGASRFKGVYVSRGGRWGSRIKRNKKTVHLGTHDTEVQAAMAYDRAAVQMHGEFARTNQQLGLY